MNHRQIAALLDKLLDLDCGVANLSGDLEDATALGADLSDIETAIHSAEGSCWDLEDAVDDLRPLLLALLADLANGVEGAAVADTVAALTSRDTVEDLADRTYFDARLQELERDAWDALAPVMQCLDGRAQTEAARLAARAAGTQNKAGNLGEEAPAS